MWYLAAALLLPLIFSPMPAPPDPPPNVLFIAVDDLRPELGCYGAEHIHSPNLDALAASATLFRNAYCNIPVCGASRASLLTGLRPTLTRFKRYYTRADEDAPEAVTLPGFLQQHGYTTISNGKVFHVLEDSAEDWDEIWRGQSLTWRDYRTWENTILDTVPNGRGFPFEIADIPDSVYLDGQLTQKTIRDLRRLQRTGQPFFLAAGFLKPHLPFNAPRKYWDLYQRSAIALPANRHRPEDVPAEAWHNSGELRAYFGVPPEGPVSEELARKLIHGYYACVSYTDALIGEVLAALDELGLSDNTLVVLWGDHGWNLLEHGLWCKHSNYRTSLKTPLIVRLPGQSQGFVRREMVEFVDIYPTVVEALGLERPGHLQGNSLTPLLANARKVPWKSQVESVWRNGFTYTSRSHAYTEWFGARDSVVARMLFDHRADPAENHNLAGEPPSTEVMERMAEATIMAPRQ